MTIDQALNCINHFEARAAELRSTGRVDHETRAAKYTDAASDLRFRVRKAIAAGPCMGADPLPSARSL
jgi:hypothetical protein